MKMIITAPDAYNSTSICLSATILAMTRDRDKMPKEFVLIQLTCMRYVRNFNLNFKLGKITSKYN